MSRRRKAEPKRRPWVWILLGLFAVSGFVGFQWLASQGRDPFDLIRRGRFDRPQRTFFAEPVGLDVMPAVAAGELGAATRSDALPREVTGRLVYHDGRPASGHEYWLVMNPHPPQAELRGELAPGCLLKPLAKCLARTDAEGRFAGFVVAEGSVALVVRVHASLVFARVLEGGQEPLAIPELAPFELSCDGIAKGSTLRVHLTPAFRKPGFMKKGYGGARDIALPLEGRAGASGWSAGLLSADQLFTWNDEPVRVAWPAGLPADVSMDGIGFDLVPGSSILEAPARLATALGRRFQVATLGLDDPNRAGGSGFVVMSRRPDPTELRRRAPLAVEPFRFDLRADEETVYVLDVVDAQFRHERVEVKEKELSPSGLIELAAASASAPLVLTVPNQPHLESAQLYCEKGDRIIVPLTPASQYQFLIDEFGCWASTGPGRFSLADPPQGWRQIFVVLPDGEVSVIAESPKKLIEAEWLPSKDAGEIDLRKFAAEHLKGKAGTIDFILFLRSREGVDQIISADRVEIPRDLGHLPVWKKRIAKGVVARLVIQIPEEMLEEVPLPLEGR